jgi:hypothetical protein
MSNQEPDFDWGKAQDCNIDVVFRGLRYEAEKAIAARNDGFVTGDHFTIAWHVHGDRFDVVREREIIAHRGFEQHRETEITTHLIFRRVLPNFVTVSSLTPGKETEVLKGTVILNDARQCRLKLGDQEIEGWRFLTQALENLPRQ